MLTLTYLWLPYMILPMYAGFERLPESQLEASADLGATPSTTFRRVALPALVPAIAAGSIFTFSLRSATTSPCRSSAASSRPRHGGAPEHRLDLPFAAALGTVSVVIMVLYLLAVRRTGALDKL